jgi:UDP-N-acetylmuramoylalanine-D-glutamate ligase
MEMRILVCGGRDYCDYHEFDRRMDDLYSWLGEGEDFGLTVIQGGAKGADFLAKGWAKSLGFPCTEFPADWKKHGKAAGAIRNQQMLDEGKPDLVVAFPGGNGTKDMVSRARKAGIEVIEVE